VPGLGGLARMHASPRERFAPHAESRALMRQAAQDVGQWDTKSETAAFDPVEMVGVSTMRASDRVSSR
jgi:hypothetical protein